MHRYQPRTPRTPIALAALALTVVTMAGAVLWPALAETSRAAGIDAPAVLVTSDAGAHHLVQLQCPPQG